MENREVVQLIREKGYGLYKILNDNTPSFEEMQKEGPVEILESGEHTYFIAPTPSQNQTLKEAYSLTKGLGPSLVISPTYEGLLDIYKGSSTCEKNDEIFFSRLSLEEDLSTVLMTPRTGYNPDPSGALLETHSLFEIFKNNFRIVKPEKYGKTVPIPHAQDPTKN